MAARECPAGCGRHVDEGWEFCPNCGVKITPAGDAEFDRNEGLRKLIREEMQALQPPEPEPVPEPAPEPKPEPKKRGFVEQIFGV